MKKWLVEKMVCQRNGMFKNGLSKKGLSKKRFVEEMVCRRNDLSKKWFVEEIVCRRDGLSKKCLVKKNGLPKKRTVCQKDGLPNVSFDQPYGDGSVGRKVTFKCCGLSSVWFDGGA